MRLGAVIPQGAFSADTWVKIFDYTIPNYGANDKLLIHGNAIADATGKTVTANGGAAVTTAQYKFAEVGASIVFDGTGDYLTLADSDDWNLGSGNFTIDFLLMLNSSTDHDIVAQRVDDSNRWRLQVSNASSAISFFAASGGSTVVNVACSYTFSLSTWYHVAVVRNGTTWYIFVNGVSQSLSSNINGTIPDLATSLYIGANSTPDKYLDGWLSMFRITKGTARWTSNFTPPVYEDYGGATTSITISGLDGNTDVMYRLTARTINGYNGQSATHIRPNNDSAANYGYQQLYGTDATFGAGRSTNRTSILNLTYTDLLNDSSIGELYLYTKSGYVRPCINIFGWSILGTTVGGIELDGKVWNNTADNITSLVVFADQTNGLGIGTAIELWKPLAKV